MYKALKKFSERPPVFSRNTVEDLWTDAHIGEHMLRHHLDPDSAAASRQASVIDASVAWLDNQLSFQGKRVCDLGCGPGLYATRFCALGAEVIGIDFSPTSIAYAQREATRLNQRIVYKEADYTTSDLPGELDVATLIFCDFAVLAPNARASLLRKIRKTLKSDGSFVLDVPSLAAFGRFCEETIIEAQYMGGFWSSDDYVGLKRSYRYEADKVTLDHYLIIEATRERQIFNWLQYFSLETLTAELEAAGFATSATAGSIAGEPIDEQSDAIAVIARAV